MAAPCLQCSHDFKRHAPAYDEYDFERYCYECDCLMWEGDIDEAWEGVAFEQLWGEGVA